MLKSHDSRLEVLRSRGKGAQPIIEHPDIDGRRTIVSMTYHKGKDVCAGVLNSIIHRL